jgi:hypothetical protein
MTKSTLVCRLGPDRNSPGLGVSVAMLDLVALEMGTDGVDGEVEAEEEVEEVEEAAVVGEDEVEAGDLDQHTSLEPERLPKTPKFDRQNGPNQI